MLRMLLTLAHIVPYSLERAQQLDEGFFSYGIYFYLPSKQADNTVELIDKFNGKTDPVFQIMVVDCQLPQHAELCALHGVRGKPVLKYFNIEKDEKTILYEGDFEEEDLWLDIQEEISNPWAVSPEPAALIDYLQKEQHPTLLLFTPGAQPPLLFIKLGFTYAAYLELIWQPMFKDITELEGQDIASQLKPGKLNLVIASNGKFDYYGGKWSKPAIQQFLNDWILTNEEEIRRSMGGEERDL